MGLCLRLWSLSQVRRPAIDSSKSAWECRPTRLRIHFSPLDSHRSRSHFLMTLIPFGLNFPPLYFLPASKMVNVRMSFRLMT